MKNPRGVSRMWWKVLMKVERFFIEGSMNGAGIGDRDGEVKEFD